jgi:hypothetical protein
VDSPVSSVAFARLKSLSDFVEKLFKRSSQSKVIILSPKYLHTLQICESV